MANSATLAIKVIADTKQAQAELSGASGRMGKFGASMQKAAVPAGIALAGIVAFGKGALEAASNTQQAFGAVDSVFGKNSATVKKWANDAAVNVGLARSDYGQLAALIGSQLKNAGIPMDQLAGKTDKLITKGADLASMFGGTTREAVEALSSGLKGEFDPLEKYGVTMNATKLNAELAARGLDKLTGKAASQAKTMVLLDEINKQTKDSTGNFAKESDTAAGSAAIAEAQYTNMKDTLGQALLPIVAKVTAALAKMAGWIEDNSKTAQIIIGVLAGLAAAVLVVNAAIIVSNAAMAAARGVMLAYKAITTAMTVAQYAFNLALAANPIGVIVVAIIALGVAFIIAYKKSKTFREFVQKMWAGIKRAVAVVAGAVKRAWSVALNAIQSQTRGVTAFFKAAFRAAFAIVKAYIVGFRAYFVLVFNVVKGIIRAVIAIFKGDWRGAFAAVKGIVQAFKQFFLSIFHALPGPVQDILVRIKNALSNAFDFLKQKASGLGSAISAPFETLYDWVQKVIDAVSDLIGWIGKIHVPDIHLPSIPGLGRSVVPAAPLTPGQPALARGATVGTRAAPSASGGPTIVIQGALDPEAVARQVQRLLGSHDRRVGVA